MQILNDDKIQVPVLIDVSKFMTFESFWVVLLNDMGFEVPAAVILVQIELVIRQGIGTGQVHITVTVNICGGNAKTICISIIHQPFVK